MAAELGRMAAAAGARTVRLRVEPTKRNTPARTFLESIVPAALLETASNARCRSRRSPPSGSMPPPALPRSADDAPAAAAATPQSAERLRHREQQIARTAFALSTGAGLRRGDRQASPPNRPRRRRSAERCRRHRPRRFRGGAAHTSAERVAAAGSPRSARLRFDADRRDHCRAARQVPLAAQRRCSSSIDPSARSSTRSSALANKGRGGDRGRRNGPGRRRPARNTIAAGDIAVVGMHLRCAGANSPDELWQLLSQRRQRRAPGAGRPPAVPPTASRHAHRTGLVCSTTWRGSTPSSSASRRARRSSWTRRLRLFLEVAWAALEDAGCLGANHEPATGVFAGVMYGDYGVRANDAPAEHDSPYRCWEGFSLANRLSQLLGFHGPSLAVDTACSSSGTALHLACAALKAGDCPVAVVGGVNLILDPDRFASLGRLGILSERGRCEPFGADADGTVLGEGAGVVVLRPLEDAAAARRPDLRRHQGHRPQHRQRHRRLHRAESAGAGRSDPPQPRQRRHRSPHGQLHRNARHRHRASAIRSKCAA